MFKTQLAFILFLTATVTAQVQPQQSHTTENLRGISIFDRDNIWASGANGTYLMTKDAGASWNVGKVRGAESLDFRGVKAFHKDRKSTRLNSSHPSISYAVFCLKKK